MTSDGEPVPYASVYVKGGTTGTSADADGSYQLNILTEEIKLVGQSQGFRLQTKVLNLSDGADEVVNFNLAQGNESLDEVVITGTRTEKRQTDSPVIVNLIDSESPEQVQATDLSEGLRFQPGFRVEVDGRPVTIRKYV